MESQNTRVAELRRIFEEKYGSAGPPVEFAEDEGDIAEVYLAMLMFALRPQMMTGHGTFDEMTAYLRGLWYGLGFHKRHLWRRGGERGFSVWIAERYNTARNAAWCGPTREAYPEEREAMVQTPILFATYLDEVSAGLWSDGKRL